MGDGLEILNKELLFEFPLVDIFDFLFNHFKEKRHLTSDRIEERLSQLGLETRPEIIRSDGNRSVLHFSNDYISYFVDLEFFEGGNKHSCRIR
jgi:hypothetical protein